MLEAMSLQKVHPWRAKSFKFQVEALHLLHMGGVEHDQGRDGGVDVPSVYLGGKVRWITWAFYGIFINFPLGYLSVHRKCVCHLWGKKVTTYHHD